MLECYSSGDFHKNFSENMKELGLPVPSSLFDTYQTAVATATTLVGTLSTIGKGASAYVGATIGSIAVISGRSLSCGSRISVFFAFMHHNNLEFKGSSRFYPSNPQIFDKSHSGRSSFVIRAKKFPMNFEYS